MPKNSVTRLLSIDIFRGITVALMILVNGLDNHHGYQWLAHSSWHGCTLADLVFPFFIFIVGVSVVLSNSKLQEKGLNNNQLIYKAIKRACFLFAVGLLLNAYPKHFDLNNIRVLGVLQRIAICYFVSSLLFINTRMRTQLFILIGLLIGYWFIMTSISVPGFGAGDLTRLGNVATFIDSLIIPSNYLYLGGPGDPEGILSTLPAIATAILGNLLGFWLISQKNAKTHILGISSAGLIIMTLGWVWGFFFPMNKQLWTSSYVLWSAGLALLLYAICYWLIEVKQWTRGFKPFEIFGLNAMTAYVFHVVFLKTQAVIFFKTSSDHLIGLRLLLTNILFGWTTPQNASLFYGITFTLFCLFVITTIQINPFSFSKFGTLKTSKCT